MDKIAENHEELIEKLQAHLLKLDPGDPQYGKLQARLDAMMRQRSTDFRNELDAIENNERLEFDRWKAEKEAEEKAAQRKADQEKTEKEYEINKVKNRNDKVRNVVEFLKTGFTVCVPAALTWVLAKKEMDPVEPINVRQRIWNLIPKIK